MKKVLFLQLVLLITIISCSDDHKDLIDTPDPGPGVSATDQSVEVAFKSSETQNGSVLFSDEDVEELDILVFKGDKYQYRRNAYSSNYATFRSTLKIDTDLDLYFFANSRSALTDEVLTEGARWDEIQERLVISFTDTLINGKQVLPMWGQVKNTRVSDDIINRYEVTLLRSVASANIIFNLKDSGTLAFKPVMAYVYYTSDCGFLAPDKDNLSFDDGELMGVLAAESPSYMRTNIRKRMDFDPVKVAFPAPFVMFDNETSETSKKHPENRRTRLVVGGHLNGSSALTYYPLDFFSTKVGEEGILDVIRNNQYNITITAVKGEGYPDPDEAADNAAVNLDYEVIEWTQNDDTDIAVDGPNYISIVRKVTLGGKAGSQTNLRMTTTYNKEDIILSFPSSLNNATNQHNVSTDRFRAELQENESGLVIVFTALEDFSTVDASLNSEKLLLKAGSRIQFYIDIEQISTKGWQDGGATEVHF